MTKFFADSYAIMSYLEGDAAYVRAFQDASDFRTGLLNLYESEFTMLRRGVAEDEIARALTPFESRAVGVDRETLRAAARLRLRLRGDGLECSYIDAVGYAQALDLGLPFFIGDPAFQDQPGVRFLPQRSR